MSKTSSTGDPVAPASAEEECSNNIPLRPPKLEEFIPDDYFILYRVPRKYKRVWPRFARDTEPATAFNTNPNCALIKALAPSSSTPAVSNPRPPSPVVPIRDKSTHRPPQSLLRPNAGTGNHSTVFRVALRLSHPLTTRSSAGEDCEDSRSHRRREDGLPRGAGAPAAWPRGQNLRRVPETSARGHHVVAPIAHPVPVGAVVPKFSGYHVPVMEDVEREKQETVRLVLATRPGTDIHPFSSSSKNAVIQANQKFTPGERSECYPLALRLHHAEFTQNSFYRSDKTPSFRIINHGRGEHWQHKLEDLSENAKQRLQGQTDQDWYSMNASTENDTKLRAAAMKMQDETEVKQLEESRKSRWESRDYEAHKAHPGLQVPDSDF
ncbi:hypothetical protein R3P38DRAFT_3201139 [Favolaschia claudopus]|uniref:Uncharacterized protein n=1 Tax=Favolaschia claudopus TaxID=2862362 RepID=A0AAW0AVU8_9AGAR